MAGIAADHFEDVLWRAPRPGTMEALARLRPCGAVIVGGA